ncbi:Uncharacterized protein Fot_10818 [Forsythia ovata]|uniref:Uncharacterized protein n=1 Tax=Forsythia ovata TaxID=205694 RepID=A0ABD1WKR4_9LAMI
MSTTVVVSLATILEDLSFLLLPPFPQCIMHLIEIFSEHGQRVAIVIFRHLDKIRHPLSMKNFCGALIHYLDEDAEYLAVQLIVVEKQVDDAIALKSSTTVTNQVEASLEDGATNRLSTPKD